MSIPKSSRRSTASRRACSAQSRSHVLDVRVRRSTARRQRNRRVLRAVLGITAWVGLAVAIWIGFHTITKKFFLENPAYSLRVVETDLDGLMSRDEALSLTKIEMGLNIFKIDLGGAEKALRSIEQVESATIQRDWPDKISITVKKRRPVAWLAKTGDGPFNADRAWLLDKDGRMMRPYRVEPEYWRLPVIFAPAPSQIQDGDTLAMADLQAAMSILSQRAKNPASLLEIRSIDISKGYALVVTDAQNSRITFGPEDLAGQLARLELLLKSCKETGRQIESVNLIPKKYTPVRFVLASSKEPAVEEPNPEAER